MDRGHEIEATYADGVLRPDEPLALPENARVRVTVSEAAANGARPIAPTRIDPTPEQRRAGGEALERLMRGGLVTIGTLPTREQLYDRV